MEDIIEDLRDNFESEEMDIDQDDHAENHENEIDEFIDDEMIDIQDEEPHANNEPIIKYNPNDFNLEKIIQILTELKVIKKNFICFKCNKDMHLINNISFKDKICWRCTSKGPNKHDVKINIREGSIFSNLKSDIALFFIIFQKIKA